MPDSSTVSAGDTILASHYNNLRTDALAHAPTTGARATNSSAIVIADVTDTTITFDTEVFDTGSYWASSNGERFTITTAGLYQLHFYVGLYNTAPVAALTDYQLQLWKNSGSEGNHYAQHWTCDSSTEIDPEIDFTCLVNASANDYYYFKITFDRTDNSQHNIQTAAMEIVRL